MSLNINRNVEDSFYRYKMPPVIAKVEGKGNGIKTVIVNMTEIARALGRPPGYTTKFFGCELGSQTTMDAKVDRYIVNGEHTAARFQELLDDFIKKYVLCTNCGNPETNLYVTKNEKLEANCLACGHVFQLNMTHKLTSYILKNPPNDVQKTSSKASKSTKAERRLAKQGKGKDDHTGSNEDEDHVESSPSQPASTAPAQPPPPSVKKSKDKDSIKTTTTTTTAEADDDWSADTSEDAVRRRAEELSMGVAALTTNDDLELASADRLELFYKYVKSKVDNGKFSPKEIITEAERLDVKDKGVMVLVELLLDTDIDIAARIKTHAALIQRFVLDNEKAQKYLIGALEKLAEKYTKIADKFGHVLKQLYDADVLEEESLIEWSAKVSKKYVSKEFATKLHEKAEPFINWLKEAEEEESEDDDEEDTAQGVAVTFTPSAPQKLAVVETKTSASQNDDGDDKHDDDDGEDIDIDAI